MSGLALGLTTGLETLASLLSVPELAISADEARAVTKAVTRLAKYYDFGLSGPAGAWMGLAGTVGPIIGARYFAYRLRVSLASGLPSASQGHPGAGSTVAGLSLAA